MGFPKATPVQIETAKAAGAIRVNRYIIGPISGATEAGADAVGLGLSQSEAANGEYFPLLTFGVGTATAGAPIVANALLEAAADGKLITRVDGPIVGRARTAATGDNTLFEADLYKPVPVA